MFGFDPILTFINFVGRPVIKCLNYHRKFDEFVYDFSQAQERLDARKADVQTQLQDEHRFGTKPKREVENWLKIADEKISHARGVQDKVRKGKYLFRCCLGEHVDKTTQKMNKVIEDGAFSGRLVLNDPSSAAAKLPARELAGETHAIEEIYNYLMGDEVRKIGVCGMGGIGKTTIMKHVYNGLSEENKFTKLIWATVSQKFNVRRLQKSIASALKENLSADEETTIRAAKLSEMLRKLGRYVLILDDVWSSFSLEDVGILEPTAANGSKLVLTTRSEEVVRSMGCRKVQVPRLSTDEALRLFISIVGQDMLSNPTLKPIVRECGGLPLAIVTVAGCMRGISSPTVWENALNELRGCISRNIGDVEDKVYGCLRFSYERLKQIHRRCFLYFALYPEDYVIKKEEIIEYWMEEGLIDEMGTRKAMQGSAHSILQKLEENCLVERVGEEGTHIKLHDVVRDMALHITREIFLVKAGEQLTEMPNVEEVSENLERVSLMQNRISTIPQNMKSPKFRKLTTLLLPQNSLNEIPDSFFEHTPSLKVLDLSYNPINKLPNSISNLEHLTALLLHCCHNLYKLPSLSKLQALKKLDLGDTAIQGIPQGLEILVNLRYLDLGFTNFMGKIPNGILSKLCRLQYLAIHPRPREAEEMRELNKLEVFEGLFSNVFELNTYATQRKKPRKYFIWVTSMLINFDWLYGQYRSMCQRMEYRSMDYNKLVEFVRIDFNSGDGITLPHDIQQLRLRKCKGMRNLDDVCRLKDATDLKECRIEDCEELVSIFSSRCQVETLECLELLRLPDLKGIGGTASEGTFSSLKKIYLYSCHKVKKLFSAKWVLHNLEDIKVQDCEKMEEIIASDKEGMGTIKYTLPKLRKLELLHLPELKSICSKNGVMVCDSLQQIVIRNCPELKRIPLDLPLNRGKPSPPPSLKRISVYPNEWWESVEWDLPAAKKVLLPFLDES